jgi:calcineurin-like phosphoesterase family protein
MSNEKNSKIFVISDHHFGHDNILKYSPMRQGANIREHDEWLVTQHNSVVRPQDRVYFLGDVAISPKHLHYLSRMNGQKFLVRGNHDTGNVDAYAKYFCNIYGLVRKEHFWFSHAPIHPCSLRGGYNIHGHLHHNLVPQVDGKPDPRYISACIEHNNGVPLALADLRKKYPRPERMER